jgi:hypothetical protein
MGQIVQEQQRMQAMMFGIQGQLQGVHGRQHRMGMQQPSLLPTAMRW